MNPFHGICLISNGFFISVDRKVCQFLGQDIYLPVPQELPDNIFPKYHSSSALISKNLTAASMRCVAELLLSENILWI